MRRDGGGAKGLTREPPASIFHLTAGLMRRGEVHLNAVTELDCLLGTLFRPACEVYRNERERLTDRVPRL
jgi:hypothetical protein